MQGNKFLFIWLLFFSLNSFGQAKIDNLFYIIKINQPDTNTVNAYVDLCKEYSTKNIEKAVKYGQQGLQLSIKIGFYNGVIKCLNNIGLAYFNFGNYAKAIEFYSKSLKVNDFFTNKDGIADSYNALGNIYTKQGNYFQALKYYQQSLKLYEVNEDMKGKAICYNNIGIIYDYQKNNSLAIEYFNKSLKTAIENNYIHFIITNLINIGNIYYHQKVYFVALKYYLNALKLCKYSETNMKSNCYNNIGTTYLEMGNFDTALIYLQKAFYLHKNSNNKYGISVTLNSLGDLFEKKGNYKKSIEYTLQSIEIAKEINSLEIIANSSSILAESYFKLYNYKKAYEYHKLYKETNDSIYNITSSQQIKELEAKYQFEKKEKKIELLNKENEIKNAKIEKNRIIQGIFIAGIILIFTILLLIFSRYQIKQKKIRLSEKLKNKKEQLQIIIDSQEKERQIIARDLHDSVGQTIATIKINFETLTSQINSLSSPESQNLVEIISGSIDAVYNEIRDISHQMMPQALIDNNISEAIEELLEKTLSTTDIKYTFNKFHLENIDSNIEKNLYRIMQELLNNIIKHAKAHHISVQLFKTKNEIVMIVEDDGVGIGNNDKLSKGIGLTNIESRVNTLNGKFRIFPGDKGTVASIRICLLNEENV